MVFLEFYPFWFILSVVDPKRVKLRQIVQTCHKKAKDDVKKNPMFSLLLCLSLPRLRATNARIRVTPATGRVSVSVL